MSSNLTSAIMKENMNGIKRPLSEVMVENSDYSRGLLKARLLKDGILQNICSECGQLPIHNGKNLVLHLEHKNGVNNDHRLENLCILCPNCHSQSPTFAGRNNKRVKQIKIYKGRNGPKYGKRKVIRPSKEELHKLLWQKPTTLIAHDYGVSDKAVYQWAKRYEIDKPPRGYWTGKEIDIA